MPQLSPLFFLNQYIYAFFILLSIIYLFSMYVLPYFTLLQVTRVYITKLSSLKQRNSK
uniref:ATP synthase F0 subunit 8 n=1 Tax=Squamanita imbachii TaxID=2976389 RepID=UPI0030E4AD2C